MKRVLGLVAFIIPTLALSTELPRESAVPGGIKLVAVEAVGATAPTVESAGHRSLVVPAGGHWVAVIGIPLSAQPGKYEFTWQEAGAAHRGDFEVGQKTYLTQALRVAPAQVNLSRKDLARVAREREHIDAALDRWSDAEPQVLRFAQPVPGERSSSFGLRRIFNGEARNPHSGMDIAAPSGTPVLAPAPGEVVGVGNYFFNGNTVFVDHGRGFISMYCHLSVVAVHDGQHVAAGETLGAVGMTGRATGPHLHWGLSLSHTWVDPSLFLR